ncbi:MAG: DUF4230 domain-containing protein [Firmicutes bacterium]|nr:DUF4230 domain-containing protein [Bacillota bacterium]
MSDEIRDMIKEETPDSLAEEREKLEEEKRLFELEKAAAAEDNADTLKKVKKERRKAERAARRRGSHAGSWIKGLVYGLIAGLLIGAIGMYVFAKNYEPFWEKTHEEGKVGEKIDEHFTGYTVADFQEAVVGEATQHKELIVMELPVQQSTTITKYTFGNWDIFKRSKVITYYGTGVYTIDLSGVNGDSITVDNDAKEVRITVPEAKLQYVNPDFDNIEFEDTEMGLLAFTDIKLTAEQQNELEKQVMAEMTEYLSQQEFLDQADEIAVAKSWETFQPLVSGVAPEYKVVIVMAKNAPASN